MSRYFKDIKEWWSGKSNTDDSEDRQDNLYESLGRTRLKRLNSMPVDEELKRKKQFNDSVLGEDVDEIEKYFLNEESKDKSEGTYQRFSSHLGKYEVTSKLGADSDELLKLSEMEDTHDSMSSMLPSRLNAEEIEDYVSKNTDEKINNLFTPSNPPLRVNVNEIEQYVSKKGDKNSDELDLLLKTNKDFNKLGDNAADLKAAYEELKNINYKRFKVLFQELFLTLKKQNEELNVEIINLKKMRVNELMKHILDQNIPIELMKMLFKEQLRNDYMFKHYFKILIKNYKKHLMKLIINEATKYLKRSKQIDMKIKTNECFDLFTENEQLELILNYLNNIPKIKHLKDYKQKNVIFTESTTNLFDLLNKMKLNEVEEQDYIAALNNCYLHYIQRLFKTYRSDDEGDRTGNKILNILDLVDKELEKVSIYDQEKKFYFIRGFKYLVSLQIEIENIDSVGEIIVDVEADQIADRYLCEYKKDRKKFNEYENFVREKSLNMNTAKHLLQLVDVYSSKIPYFKGYIDKTLNYVSKVIQIYKAVEYDQIGIAYEKRGVAYKKLSDKYGNQCVEKLEFMNRAKFDFIWSLKNRPKNGYEFSDLNFVRLYELGLGADNVENAFDCFNKAIELNPYLYEAHYQRLLCFYELKNLTKIHRLSDSFKSLINAKDAVLEFFKIIIRRRRKSKKKQRSKLNEPDQFLNKTFEVKIKNFKEFTFYVKLLKLGENFYELNCNNLEYLNYLLRNGKLSAVEIRQEKFLKEKLYNRDMKRILENIMQLEENQVKNLEDYCRYFEYIEFCHGYEFLDKLDVMFLKTLIYCRKMLIELYINNGECGPAIKHISKARVECRNLINKTDSKKIKNKLSNEIDKLYIRRADLYRLKNRYYCEEDELTKFVEKQRTGFHESNPVIYHRLAVINKNKSDFDDYEKYVHLAKRKYFEKANKKIFKKVNTEIVNFEKRMVLRNVPNLFRIFSILKDNKFDSLGSVEKKLKEYNVDWISRKTIFDCLAVHFSDRRDFEMIEKNTGKLLLDMRDILKHDIEKEDKNIVDVVCHFFKIQMIFVSNKFVFELKPGHVPIVIMLDENKNYKTARNLNVNLYLASLFGRYNPDGDIKSACFIWLKEGINKNFGKNSEKNNDIENSYVLSQLLKCETIKEFSENIIYYFIPSDRISGCFGLWSNIADLELNLKTCNILKTFKETFIGSIDEFIEEIKEQDALEIKKIEEDLEANRQRQKEVKIFFDFVEKIKEKLHEPVYIRPKSANRKNLEEQLASNNDYGDKMISIAGLLEIPLEADEELAIRRCVAEDENTLEKILNFIQNVLDPPQISCMNGIVTVKGHTVFLSTIIDNLEKRLKNDKKIFEIQISGIDIFIDCSIENDAWKGINLSLGAEKVEFIDDVTIDLSGSDGKNGNNGENQRNATKKGQDGFNGLPGEDGQPGKNGGHFILIAHKNVKGSEGVKKIKTSGGNGGRGGNGGNGGNGKEGKEGENGEVPDRGFKGSISDGYYNIDYGTNGTRGGNGGFGGSAGLGAYGGTAGKVTIEINGVNLNDAYSNSIESEDKSTKPAEDGKPGEGGKGALGGADGYDEMRIKRSFYHKKKQYRGKIKIKKWGSHWAPFAATVPEDWDCEPVDKGKQRLTRRGVDRGVGESAEKQINNGKTRGKSHNKNRSNKKDIKSQLTNALNQNENMSKEVSYDIELLQGHLREEESDMTHQRDARIRAQQNTHTLLQQTQMMAQQVMNNINANIQATQQQTIIADANRQNNEDNISSIMNELKCDDELGDEYLIHKNSRKRPNQYKVFEVKFSQEKDNFVKKIEKEIENIERELIKFKNHGKSLLFKLDLSDVNKEFILSGNKTNSKFSLMDSGQNIINDDEIQKIIFDETNDDSIFDTKRWKSLDSNGNEGSVYIRHFETIFELSNKKSSLKKLKKELEKFDIEACVKNLCLEYGNVKEIDKRLTGLSESFDAQNLTENKMFMKNLKNFFTC